MAESASSARLPGVREVAAAAGVSRQTVSRVLNDSPSIRPETRERVLAAMAELEFRPNRAARMLTTARSRTIGVLASSASALYGPASSLDAVENAARDSGYFVTVAHAFTAEKEEILAALDHLMDQSVDGIVVIAPQQRVQDAMLSVHFAVPAVELHGAGTGEEAGLVVDQVEGARLAVRHLMGRGHARILHVCGPLDWAEARARRAGFLLECEVAGAGAIVSRAGDWTAASGAEIAAEFLADRTITAVFSSNDQMALGVLHAARRAGRSVPGDLAVVGFDDIPEAAFFAPPLTTVRQDFAELGRRTVARLVAMVEGRELAFAEPVPPALIVRESA
ncbi:LacI family DNA-binding transcriptional regulator [Sinomonas sp. ASV322]|uniref:LacI family DNA-binding transcriptional regulator n=1 Tax=Sinomonas sp. ASV322 TaxID=3041920 RepID=UPI0027DD6148|nr:LacI family DNA-binding transcriptional regulator [Sinomonas sp. ASV322]MDQ4502364.1 LacI family DNA-binding transcriptional regulator [Sinomonas sp. ASV322]